jgi:hypothetical protein
MTFLVGLRGLDLKTLVCVLMCHLLFVCLKRFHGSSETGALLSIALSVKKAYPLGDAGTWFVIVPSRHVVRETDEVREPRRFVGSQIYGPKVVAKAEQPSSTTPLSIVPSSISYFLLNNDIWHHDTDEVNLIWRRRT